MTWSRKGDRGVKGCSAKDQNESTAESSKPSGGGGRGRTVAKTQKVALHFISSSIFNAESLHSDVYWEC